MTTSRRRRLALLGILGFVALAAGFRSLALSIPRLREYRSWIKAARAGMLGASFEGEAGVILQARGNDCGAACLKMVLDARGIEQSLPDLTRELSLTPAGVSMFELRLAAARLGVRGRSWSLGTGDLGHAPLPAIALIKGGHFVVIRRFVVREVLEVDDPALGRLQWPVRSFRRVWSGETLIFDPKWIPPGFSNQPGFIAREQNR